MKAFKLLPGIFVFAAIAACSAPDAKRETATSEKTPVAKIQEPFRFHKAIEVKPGLTFDVLSWGRGSKLVGGYLILRSDSTHAKYRSLSDELEGTIVDAWNMDMDADGNPEIFIQTVGDEKGENDSYLGMYVYEFNDSGSSQKLRFPELSSKTRKQYRGKDSVYVKDGNIIRQFPVVDEKDTTATSMKVLQYGLHNNTFTVKELEGDNADKKSQ